jgi:hypothetical protein
LRDAREQAGLQFRFRREDVINPPRRVQSVHAENLKRAANKGNDFRSLHKMKCRAKEIHFRLQ